MDMVKTRRGGRLAIAGWVVACGFALAACGSNPATPAASQPSETVTAVTAQPSATDPPAVTTPPISDSVPQQPVSSTSAPPSALVEIVGIYEAVRAYPACGNEPLEHLGVSW